MTHAKIDDHILPLELACRQAVHAYPGKVAGVAAVLGWKASTLQNKLNPTQDAKLTAYEAEQILELTRDDRILDTVCHLAGAVWLKLGDFDGLADDMAMLDNITDLVSRTGELAREVHEALSDGKVDAAELKRLQYRLYRLMQAGHGVLARAKQFQE